MNLKLFSAILLCLFVLSGCGKQETEEVQENIPTVNWKTNGFAVSGEVLDEQGFWVEQYIPWTHEGVIYDGETEGIAPFRIPDVCYGDKIYRLNAITWFDNFYPHKYLMETYDTSSMETTVTEFTLEQLDLQNTSEYREYMVGMDVVNEQICAFQVLGYTYIPETMLSQVTASRMNYYDSEGGIETADELPVYLEQGILSGNVGSIITTMDCFCDGAGNSYVRKNGEELLILDREAKLIMAYEGKNEFIQVPMKTAGGELIFPIWSNREGMSRLVWFDLETNQPSILAELKGEQIKQLYGMQGNLLYYEGRSGIIRWDVVSGTRQLVFRFDENGVSNLYDTMLVFQEGKTPILRAYGIINDEEEDWLMVLSDEPVERQDAVRVVCLTEISSRVKECAAVASRRNPNHSYVYEDGNNKNAEDYRTQIIAELMAGNGPDILYVSREDMELLQRRGMLADLRTLISEETVSQVIPGVLELGTADGILVGMAPGIMAESILIGDSVWSGSSWTLADILELMENSQLENRMLMEDRTSFYIPLGLQNKLIKCSLENSFLIDWEEGESHFEDERFVSFLECTGKESSAPYEGLEESGAGNLGKLMVDILIAHPFHVATFQGTHGADGNHYVGYPTEGGNGSYLYADGMLVVNKNLADPEAVSAYLECLWGSEIQSHEDSNQYSLAVTYPSADDIKYDTEGEPWWHTYRLTVYEDGTTALDEAITFLTQCVPAPKTYTDLENILYEELKIYNQEADRTAEDTARIIDRRIQVYLDEGN